MLYYVNEKWSQINYKTTVKTHWNTPAVVDMPGRSFQAASHTHLLPVHLYATPNSV